MKKNSVIILCIVVLSLLASAAVNAEDVRKIGIIQQLEHASLDAAYKGFVDGLADAGYVDGKNIQIDYQNAQGDQANLMTISDRFVKNKEDLILAIATNAAQAAASATSDIPVLITAVTDPVAARLVESNEKPNTNVTGTTDMQPIDKQIQLIKELFPDAKTLGIMYNSSEVNSEVQSDLASKYAKELGMDVKIGTVTSVNDIDQVASSMVSKVDAFYIPSDNTIASAMPNLVKVTDPAKKPVIVAVDAMVADGGLATIGIDYYKLGKQTAAMAVKVLKGESKPADMPIESLEDVNIVLNQDAADAIGYTFPKDILGKASQVYKK